MYKIRLSTFRMKTCAALIGVVESTVPDRLADSGSEAASMVAVVAPHPPTLTNTYPAARLPANAMASSTARRALTGRRRRDDPASFKKPIVVPPRHTRVEGL